MTRIEALENVAAAARHVQDLERMLVSAADIPLVNDRLYEARQYLSKALEDLDRLDHELN